MRVGDYVKVVDNSMARHILSMNEVVEITKVIGDDLRIEIKGSPTEWDATRFEPLPILTEAPPKGSKVVKVEKSDGNSLVSDKYLGEVVTTVGGQGDELRFCGIQEGGFYNSDITKGKWALVSLPKTEEPLFAEIKGMKKGDYVKVISNLDRARIGEIVQYTGRSFGGGEIVVKFKDGYETMYPIHLFEKLPILTEPVPVGSKVVKIKKDRSILDGCVGQIVTTCEPATNIWKDNQWIKLHHGDKYSIDNSRLSSWALVEAAKVETEFQVGDRVVPREEITTTETRQFQGECLNICLLYTSPSPRDATLSRMPSSA